MGQPGELKRVRRAETSSPTLSWVSRGAEVNPSGGIETADAAVRAGSCGTAERPFAGAWVRQPGRWSSPRRVDGCTTLPRSSLPNPSFVSGRSPGQWPDLLVIAVIRKIACLFVLCLTVWSVSYSGLLDRKFV